MASYEVELKFAAEDFGLLRAKLGALDAQALEEEQHQDTYYAHPSKDFASTKEALRVRRVNGNPFVTYKGPKLAGEVKTRVELEWNLAPGDADGSKMESLLVHLDFRKVADVLKRRESFRVGWHGHSMTVTLDDVEGVGRFTEIERLAEQSDLDQAQSDVVSLAKELGLGNPEPRSYLRMLLES